MDGISRSPDNSISSRTTRPVSSESKARERALREANDLGKPKASLWKNLARFFGAGAAVAGGATVVNQAGVENPIGNTVTSAIHESVDTVAKGVNTVTEAPGNLVDNYSELGRNPAHGKYLKLQEDGSLVLSEEPQIVSLHYEATLDPTSRNANDGKIILRDKYQLGGNERSLDPKEITATLAARIAGGTFSSSTQVGGFTVADNGKEYRVGEWFSPRTADGKPANEHGEPLKEGEKEIFISANFATVTTPPSDVDPNPASHGKY